MIYMVYQHDIYDIWYIYIYVVYQDNIYIYANKSSKNKKSIYIYHIKIVYIWYIYDINDQ